MIFSAFSHSSLGACAPNQQKQEYKCAGIQTKSNNTIFECIT
jgi:hypothetical protein